MTNFDGCFKVISLYLSFSDPTWPIGRLKFEGCQPSPSEETSSTHRHCFEKRLSRPVPHSGEKPMVDVLAISPERKAVFLLDWKANLVEILGKIISTKLVSQDKAKNSLIRHEICGINVYAWNFLKIGNLKIPECITIFPFGVFHLFLSQTQNGFSPVSIRPRLQERRSHRWLSQR